MAEDEKRKVTPHQLQHICVCAHAPRFWFSICLCQFCCRTTIYVACFTLEFLLFYTWFPSLCYEIFILMCLFAFISWQHFDRKAANPQPIVTHVVFPCCPSRSLQIIYFCWCCICVGESPSNPHSSTFRSNGQVERPALLSSELEWAISQIKAIAF